MSEGKKYTMPETELVHEASKPNCYADALSTPSLGGIMVDF